MEGLKQIRVFFIEKLDSSRNALEARIGELAKHLESEHKSLEDREKELEAKARNFKSEMASIANELRSVESLIEEKERDCSSIQKCIVGRKEELNKCNEEIRLKETQLNAITGLIEDREKEMEAKVSNLKSEMESMTKELHTMERLIEEKGKEVGVKEKRLWEVEKLVEEKEKMIREMEPKVKELASIINAMEERIQNVKSEGKTLVRSPSLQLNATTDAGNVQSPPNEVLSENCSVQNKMCVDDLQKSAVPERLVLEKLTQTSFATLQSVKTQVDSGETQVIKEEPLPESLSFEGVPISDSKELLVYLNARLKDRELLRELISNALKASVDSAKLVLDAVRWFFAPENKEEMDFEVNIIRRSCVLLLEVLMKLRPVIKPEVSKEAMQLALDWKAEVKDETKNCVEVWGYLQLLGAFGLVGQFDNDEILKFVGCVAERKLAPDLFRDLGFADKASGFIQKLISENKQVDAVRFIHAFEQLNKFPPVPLLRAHLKFAMKDVRMSYKKGQDLKTQHEAIDKEMVALRGIVRCIEEYKLDIESQYFSETLRKHINELERQKTKERVATLKAGGSGTQVQHLSGKKRAASDFKGQPNKQNRSKHPRIAPVSAARHASYGAPSTTHRIPAFYLRQETIQPSYLRQVGLSESRGEEYFISSAGLPGQAASPSNSYYGTTSTFDSLRGSHHQQAYSFRGHGAEYAAGYCDHIHSTQIIGLVGNTNPSPTNSIANAYADPRRGRNYK